jgi:predicted RNase H-like HicB family nuclease
VVGRGDDDALLWENNGLAGAHEMKIKVIVHEADEGGYWAEVPAIPGCATQGETFEDLLKNLYEAVEGCLSVELQAAKPTGKDRVLEIAI